METDYGIAIIDDESDIQTRPVCEQEGCRGQGVNQYYCADCKKNVCDVCKFHHMYNIGCKEILRGTGKENGY